MTKVNNITEKNFVDCLGPKEQWDSSLKDAVEYCLGASYPVTIYYGEEDKFNIMYNQKCAEKVPVIRYKHLYELAFGKEFRKVLPHNEYLVSLYKRILNGETEYKRDVPHLDPIKDNKEFEQRYYTYLMSPIRNKDDIIKGMLCVSEDTTDKVLGIERVPNCLTRLIKELTTVASLQITITEIREEESENSENLLYLYNKITDAENRNKIANQEVIKSYYSFGKALIQRFKYYSDKSFNEHQAQIAVNKELKKQLPGTTKNARNKRKERAQKIYSLFNNIGIEKIELVKSFSADSISKLSIKNIEYVKDEVKKTASQST
ncbi:PAS/PAC sensor hybrid histidine kinase [Gigaspora margarita]|uniref:PAS/PAC sensor hybrid histidine kinase n=1 Tax=Gigaspora margarita TaxID=4874 RepID=A0A8H4EM72_GIGMA|nr:PAS/PAC sensor hybrid histidine kinase [Gigaspora margarita]